MECCITAACSTGYPETIDLLISKGANNLNEALSAALNNNNEYIVKYMISKGASTNASII